jgi:hypothetical protein
MGLEELQDSGVILPCRMRGRYGAAHKFIWRYLANKNGSLNPLRAPTNFPSLDSTFASTPHIPSVFLPALYAKNLLLGGSVFYSSLSDSRLTSASVFDTDLQQFRYLYQHGPTTSSLRRAQENILQRFGPI